MSEENNVLGIDEAGRGPWAGPVYVAMVLGGSKLSYARDSKTLSVVKRIEMLSRVEREAEEIAIGQASSVEIDKLGLSQALKLASSRAFSQISKPISSIIVDGKHNFTGIEDIRLSTVIKADSKFPQVSAASIVAKVHRDNWMKKYHDNHPQWRFDKHFGYGTKLHKEMIYEYGLSDIHRRSFKPIQVYEESKRTKSRSSSSDLVN